MEKTLRRNELQDETPSSGEGVFFFAFSGNSCRFNA
jgi:hypothetical protein